MKSSKTQYWILQILGWGGWAFINISFASFFSQNFYQGERYRLFLWGLFFEFVWYIISTHLLRLVLHRTGWIGLPISKIIKVFIIGVIATGFVSYIGYRTTTHLTHTSISQHEKEKALIRALDMEKRMNLPNDYFVNIQPVGADSSTYKRVLRIKARTGWQRNDTGEWKYHDSFSGRFWWNNAFRLILIALWLAIYMMWHFFQKNQQDKIDKLNLENTVKELELKTIKSHINPHFIFNSLNSIRALVEENPERARSAITELSNILRSSLKMEKMEEIPLEKEMKIVKDYLALEQTRFEERLKVNLEVAENTLQLLIPPMMLQTLVENAIKHGISKQIEGGLVNIVTFLKDGYFNIIIENTGQIERDITGFGIESTKNRLNLLYGNKATFSIENKPNNTVRVIIRIPHHS